MNLGSLVRMLLCAFVRTTWDGRWGWYHVVPVVVAWATYVVYERRVLGNALFALLPLVGAILMGLWLIFLIDELVDVLQINHAVARGVRWLKRGSLLVVAAYGVLGALLLVNGEGDGPVVRRRAEVAARASARLGMLEYAWWTVQSPGSSRGVQRILRSPRDPNGVYVGGDVELVLRQGRLWLWRVLEVHEDRERYLLKMLNVAPSSRVALDGLVRWHAERRNFDQAIEWYARLTRAYPYEPDTGHVLGMSLVNGRRYRDGAEVFRQILAMRRDWNALYGLGYALAWAGSKREAATYLKEATELEPDDFRAFYSLGYVLRDTGQYADARAAWSRVLELMPVFPEVRNNLRAIQGLTNGAR